MKKAAFFLALIFIIGAFVVFFILHRLGPTSSARLVPTSTVALLEFPDLAATSQRWENSLFAKMVREPEIKAFLERPLDRFHQMSASSTDAEALEKLLLKIKPGRLFAAVEKFEEENAWVIGCQFFGSNIDAEKGIGRLHEFLDTHFGVGEKIVLETKEKQGEIITRSSHGDFIVYSALRGNWFFVSSSLDALKKSLDFSAGRCSEKESLAATKLYQKNKTQLLSEADFFFYVRPDQALTIFPYLKAVLRNDETLTASQTVGLSLCLTNEGMKETLFFGGHFSTEASLAHDGLRLTQPTTLGYVERTNQWDKVFAILQDNKDLPPGFIDLLSPAGIDLGSLAGLLKPETVMVIDWPKGHSLPAGLISMPSSDSMKINSWLEQGTAHLGMVLQSNGDLHFVSTPQLADGLKPTMAVARNDFFLGTDPEIIVQTAAQAAKSSARSTLETTAGFVKVDHLYHQANEIFAYFSTKELFERLYEKVRPGLLLGGSFMPDVSTTVDFSKLPSASVIAHDLVPIVYAQSHVQEGILIQSAGPLTAVPLFLLGSTAYTFLQKKKMAAMSPPAPVAPDAAAGTQ